MVSILTGKVMKGNNNKTTSNILCADGAPRPSLYTQYHIN